MARIVVVGSLNMDIAAVVPRLPLPGETLTGSAISNEPGGKGANQAYAAAKLGGDVAMLGMVGSDEHGKTLKTNLKAIGCDVARLHTVEGSSGIAMIFVAASGENSIVVVPGANQLYLPAAFHADAQSLVGARSVLLQLETPVETVIAAAREAKRIGAQVVLDPAPAPAMLPLDLLRHVDVLTPNATEAARLAGAPTATLTVGEAELVAGHLLNMGPSTVIIKLGANGCLLATMASTTWIPAPQVDACDTTGAGDVFNGALAVSTSEGASLAEACEFAVRTASLSVTRRGAQRSVPSRQEADAFAR